MFNDNGSKIDLIASKFLVEVDFGQLSVEFFGLNDTKKSVRRKALLPELDEDQHSSKSRTKSSTAQNLGRRKAQLTARGRRKAQLAAPGRRKARLVRTDQHYLLHFYKQYTLRIANIKTAANCTRRFLSQRECVLK